MKRPCSSSKEAVCNAGDMGSIPVRKIPRGGNDNPLQHSCLDNPMDKGAWQVTVYRVTKNQTQLSMHTCTQTVQVHRSSPLREMKNKTTMTCQPEYFCCSVAQSKSLQPHGLPHVRLLYPSLSPGACWNSCPLSQWYHPTVSSSFTPFSFYPQFFPA